MLGDTYEHLKLEESFLRWVKAERILESTSVVVEWLGSNPFAHDDPKYAPVSKYAFSPVDDYVERDA